MEDNEQIIFRDMICNDKQMNRSRLWLGNAHICLSLLAVLLNSGDCFTLSASPLCHRSKLFSTANCRLRSSSTPPLRSSDQSTTNYSPLLERKNDKKTKRKPKSRKAAIRWVVESIEKVLEEEHDNEERRNPLNEEKPDHTNTVKDDKMLLDALNQFHQGKTKRDITLAGNIVTDLKIDERFSFAVQERVMKVAAMTGLIQLSSRLLDSMVVDNKHIPSSIGYAAVLNGLRKAKKLTLLQKAMLDLSITCKETNQSLDTVALNIYIGAICDFATIPSTNANYSQSDFLREALDLFLPNVANDRYAIRDGPDTVSYNTMLNFALSSKPRNSTLATEMIELMRSNGIAGDIYTYNMRLKACGYSGQMAVAEKILIIDEILSHPAVIPDKFTIEQALIPLASEGRIGDILELLKNFNSQQGSMASKSNAYSTFLIALVKGGEVNVARAIFDTYILPTSENNGKLKENSLFIAEVRPITRHFNVLIEGYRNMNEAEAGTMPRNDQHLSPLEHATNLFDAMVAMGIKPDAYTITSLVGLQKKSDAITKLWSDKAVSELGIPLTPPVYHSIITAYGRVNDPSSACYMFDRMMRTNHLRLNSWNVILSALSKSSKQNANKNITCFQSSASRNDDRIGMDSTKTFRNGKTIGEIVDEKSVIEAAFEILEVMKTETEIHNNLVLRPNSQSYCLIASTLSHRGEAEGENAIKLYHEAMELNIPADGRFINAIIRCFGDDIDGAINAWKTLFRVSVLSNENRERTNYSKHKKGKNIIASYHGLVHVAGRACRPDRALRLAYAMKKEGFEPTESTLNNYKTGRKSSKIKKSIRLEKQYENLLTIECSNYDLRDKRRSLEKRVRIII